MQLIAYMFIYLLAEQPYVPILRTLNWQHGSSWKQIQVRIPPVTGIASMLQWPCMLDLADGQMQQHA